MTARLDVLTVGYAEDRVAGTVVAIRDGDLVIVVDPGMVLRDSRAKVLDLGPALIIPGHGGPLALPPQTRALSGT